MLLWEADIQQGPDIHQGLAQSLLELSRVGTRPSGSRQHLLVMSIPGLHSQESPQAASTPSKLVRDVSLPPLRHSRHRRGEGMGWVLAHSRVARLLFGMGLVLGRVLAGHLCCGELVLPAHFRPVLHVGPLHSAWHWWYSTPDSVGGSMLVGGRMVRLSGNI